MNSLSQLRLPFTSVFLLTLALGACSTAVVRVMPGELENRVVVRDIHKEDAEEEAVKAAKKYCEKKKQEAVFSKESSKYTGQMDEETRDTVNKASKAAMILGGGIGTAGDEPGAGSVLGGAGMVGHTMTSGKDYEAEVTFKCK